MPDSPLILFDEFYLVADTTPQQTTISNVSTNSQNHAKDNSQPNSKVLVKRLTGGITNVLFQATYYYPASSLSSDEFDSIGSPTSLVGSDAVKTAPSSSAASTTSTVVSDNDSVSDAITIKGAANCEYGIADNSITVLIRAYGNGTDALIDRDREFATHQHLHSRGLAPQLYARFGNGLVYAYLPGRSIEYTLLSHPDVTVAIARRLAEWHSRLDAQEINSQISILKEKNKSSDSKEFVETIWELLGNWIEAMPTGIIKSHTKEQLLSEVNWIQEEIGLKGGPMVAGHCDLLAGNVIVPSEWAPRSADEPANDEDPLEVSFIDYEYAMNTPRAFDIANHFMEWQGFDCVKELIPVPEASNPVIRDWASNYLSYTFGKADERDVSELVDQILSWWGMPGFFWGIWSAIQSTISNIDFDYATYANERLVDYWNWKARYIQKK